MQEVGLKVQRGQQPSRPSWPESAPHRTAPHRAGRGRQGGAARSGGSFPRPASPGTARPGPRRTSGPRGRASAGPLLGVVPPTVAQPALGRLPGRLPPSHREETLTARQLRDDRCLSTRYAAASPSSCTERAARPTADCRLPTAEGSEIGAGGRGRDKDGAVS